jgi:hypothetical protein
VFNTYEVNSAPEARAGSQAVDTRQVSGIRPALNTHG